jgi:hypothetical protein
MGEGISESRPMRLYFWAGVLVKSGRYIIRLYLRCTLSCDHR